MGLSKPTEWKFINTRIRLKVLTPRNPKLEYTRTKSEWISKRPPLSEKYDIP